MGGKLKHLDLFSGYGGFTIPAQEFGIETINFSEIDKYATAVLRFRFPNIANLGDVSKIDTRELPDFDLLTGGTPCQDLSVAGKRKGLDGERSGLFFHFVRILKEKQPRYFVWENVKGAFSSNSGWDFARVQIEMEHAGYSLQWAVLNAKDFGVPQNRERIFIIGTRGGSQREILPVPTGAGQTLKLLGGGLGAKTGLYKVVDDYNGKIRDDGLVGSVTTNIDNKALRNGTKLMEIESKQNMRIRRLTPIECERLMGLEDFWTSKGIIDGKEVDISDAQRYKMCGNGVVVNVVREIYRKLVNF